MRIRTSTVTGAALVAAILLTGCSSDYSRSGRFDHHEPDYIAPDEPAWQEPDYEREAEQAYEQALEDHYASQQQTGWSCYYDETWNYDWHDDVLCSNGLESHRPYLLEWADFVTYDEIMSAAAEYEAYLNGQ